MFWINTKRILRYGLSNFIRNATVSFSSVLIMFITLFILLTIVFINAFVDHSVIALKNSVGLNITIIQSASQDKIDQMKLDLEGLPTVDSVTFISADDALAQYVDRNKDDTKIIAGLNLLDENPIRASFVIKAKTIEGYVDIQKFIEEKYPLNDLSSIIEKLNYNDKKSVIDRLILITNAIKTIGLFVMIIFAILSILITLNTIRLTIYISKDEIRVMNLVGAEHGYITGPFIVTGGLYGLISGILLLIAFYPVTYFLSLKIKGAFFDFDFFTYYLNNFFQIFLIIVGAGLVLGMVSSLLAIKKYLKN